MELFPASDESQWELIKRVIEESDYYIVIVGGRYGSLGPNGLSYTEMEYDYAVERGIPVLGFVREGVENIPAKFTEPTEDGRSKLLAFRSKVLSRTCRKFVTPAELGMAVMKSLMSEARLRPQVGWVRADQARSEEDRQRERRLLADLEEAYETIDRLQREIRDRSILANDISREHLAQGEDTFEFTVTFRDEKKQLVTEKVAMTWNEIFRTIGPSLYGFVVRKVSRYNERPKYPFEENIEDHIRAKVIGKAQARKLDIEAGQVDACIFQLKELGLLMFSEIPAEEGEAFRGVTLTEYGEKQLTLLKTILRS